MTAKNLPKIIGTPESTTTEWKQSLSEINEIIETAVAFANTEGGKIFVGVSKTGEVLGVQIGKGTIENLVNKIGQHTDPKLHPKITVKKIDGKEIIVIEVKESPGHLVLADGRPYKRVGRSSPRMSKDEYEQLILEKHKDELEFDKAICKEAKLKDIDSKKVEAYLKLREKNRNIPSKIKMPLNQFLVNIKAVSKSKPTNAGILFFAKDSLKFIPHTQLRLIKIKGVKIYGNILDRLDCDGTLWEMADQADEFIRKNIRLLGFRTDKSFRREDKFDYPIKALREAIINGLIHRDYYNPADVRVFILDDRVEIVSPGSFPKGVTPEKPEHKPVNKLLSKLMYDIGYIEKYGSGIYLENDLCLKNGNKKPVYEISPVQTKVIFKSQVKDVTVVEADEAIISRLNERQKQFVKSGIKDISRKEYSELVKCPTRTAARDLKDLLNKNLVEKVGGGKHLRYVTR
jgi:ATP-dependent DNA helicase RecG